MHISQVHKITRDRTQLALAGRPGRFYDAQRNRCTPSGNPESLSEQSQQLFA
jgi:hypothetical protein